MYQQGSKYMIAWLSVVAEKISLAINLSLCVQEIDLGILSTLLGHL
jgi:hypothetical protein